jgi:hypothetical protein
VDGVHDRSSGQERQGNREPRGQARIGTGMESRNTRVDGHRGRLRRRRVRRNGACPRLLLPLDPHDPAPNSVPSRSPLSSGDDLPFRTALIPASLCVSDCAPFPRRFRVSPFSGDRDDHDEVDVFRVDPPCREYVNQSRPCPLPQQSLVQGGLRPRMPTKSRPRPGARCRKPTRARRRRGPHLGLSILAFCHRAPLAYLRSGSNLLLAPAMFAVRRAASHSVGVGKLLKRALLVKTPSSLRIPAFGGGLQVFLIRQCSRTRSRAVILAKS